jgi:uncharacterized protein
VLAAGVLGITAYLAVCLFIYFRQPKYIYFPSHVIEKTPALYNLPFEEVWLPIAPSNKERLHGWWIGSNHPERILLYLHGNALNIGANLYAASGFYKAGFSVLLIDYRGFGRSEGRFPNETRIYEDAATTWNYVVGERKIDPGQIYIYGHSLGGAVAIDLAIKHPDAAGLIVESTFTSVQRVTAARKLFAIFPVKLLLTQKFDSINKVSNLKIPVLFIHGINDSTVPAFMSQELYTAAPKPKQLILVPGADHNNVGEVAPLKYLKAVRSFIQVVQSNQRSHLSEINASNDSIAKN